MAELRLRRFLRASLSTRFVWGERDCGLWACDWVKEARGVDPGADVRGKYANRFGYLRFAYNAGGLPELVRAKFTASGLRETIDPKPGDVGVIPTPLGPAVAIMTTLGWAQKSERGLSFVERSLPIFVAFEVS